MDINPKDETSYTTQYQEAFLKYVENKYCAKHRQLSVIKPEQIPSNNSCPSATASGFGPPSVDAYDLRSADEEYLTPNNVAEMTPGWSNRTAPSVTAARLYSNSPPESPKNWGQVNPNLNDYHSDPMQISSTFWLPDITKWWHQHAEMHAKCSNLANEAHNIISIIPHHLGVEASVSLVRDAICWRLAKTTGETFR